jgi:riboflavin kinase/FMN adenylyltransferase
MLRRPERDPMGPLPPGRIAFPLAEVPAALKHGVVAIGNFDGVHRGHQAVLADVRAIAQRLGAPALVLTFEPHPRSFFKPQEPVFRLTPPPIKEEILAALGFDGMAVATFNAAFAARSADDFVTGVLAGALAARHVVVGYNFRYGAKRAGTPEHLAERGRAAGFDVTIVAPHGDADDIDAISSSRVRDALAEGDIAAANGLLGYRWRVRSAVIPGEKRGRTMGYPTANQRLAADCRLRHGIYAVRAFVAGAWRDGVASFGRRPTFDDGAPLLETFVFDFGGDLYGEAVEVAFAAFLRPEERFASIEALVAQMDRDSRDARAALAGLAPLTPLDARLDANAARAG